MKIVRIAVLLQLLTLLACRTRQQPLTLTRGDTKDGGVFVDVWIRPTLTYPIRPLVESDVRSYATLEEDELTRTLHERIEDPTTLAQVQRRIEALQVVDGSKAQDFKIRTVLDVYGSKRRTFGIDYFCKWIRDDDGRYYLPDPELMVLVSASVVEKNPGKLQMPICLGLHSNPPSAPQIPGSAPTGVGSNVAGDRTDPPSKNVEVPNLANLTHKPLFVLVERNPWLMVIGSDTPTVVLYEDGLAIYQQMNGDHAEAMKGHMAPAAARAFVDGAVQAGFLELPLHTMLSRGHDLPTVEILLRSGTAWHLASAYGMRRNGPASDGLSDREAPRALATVYEKALAIGIPGAQPWKADEIEVMLWDFSHARSAVEWPAGVPKPPPDVKAHGVYHHFLDGKYEPLVSGFLLSKDRKTAVMLNGTMWSMGLRPRVPEEEYIQKARAAFDAAR
jgi:hypothetical protein